MNSDEYKYAVIVTLKNSESLASSRKLERALSIVQQLAAGAASTPDYRDHTFASLCRG